MNGINTAHNLVAELSHNLNSMLASSATSKYDEKIKKPVGAAISLPRFNKDEQLDTISIASSRRSKKNKGEKFKLTEDFRTDSNDLYDAKNPPGSNDRPKVRAKPVKKLNPNSSLANNQKAKSNRERDTLKNVSKLRKSNSNHSLNKKKTYIDKKISSTRHSKKLIVLKNNSPNVLPRETKSPERSYSVARDQQQHMNDVADVEEEEEQEVRNVVFEEDCKEVRNRPLDPDANYNHPRVNYVENHAVGLMDYSATPMHNYLKPTLAYHLKCVPHNYWRHYNDVRLPFVVGTSVNTTNNVRLLRQQTASKIKNFLLYNVSCDQLSEFKLYKLRDLIYEIEKNGRKVTGTSGKSYSSTGNQENFEDSSPNDNNNLEVNENLNI